MAILELSAGFKEKRAAKLRSVPNRKSLGRRLGEVLGTLSVLMSQYTLPVLGLGALTVAAWTVALPLGLVALGISCFVLDYGKGG